MRSPPLLVIAVIGIVALGLTPLAAAQPSPQQTCFDIVRTMSQDVLQGRSEAELASDLYSLVCTDDVYNRRRRADHRGTVPTKYGSIDLSLSDRISRERRSRACAENSSTFRSTHIVEWLANTEASRMEGLARCAAMPDPQVVVVDGELRGQSFHAWMTRRGNGQHTIESVRVHGTTCETMPTESRQLDNGASFILVCKYVATGGSIVFGTDIGDYLVAIGPSATFHLRQRKETWVRGDRRVHQSCNGRPAPCSRTVTLTTVNPGEVYGTPARFECRHPNRCAGSVDLGDPQFSKDRRTVTATYTSQQRRSTELRLWAPVFTTSWVKGDKIRIGPVFTELPPEAATELYDAEDNVVPLNDARFEWRDGRVRLR